jgi:hypothetical protein
MEKTWGAETKREITFNQLVRFIFDVGLVCLADLWSADGGFVAAFVACMISAERLSAI